MVMPEVPARLTEPLEAPTLRESTHRGLLDLVSDYESLRREANADRRAIAEILEHDPDTAP